MNLSDLVPAKNGRIRPLALAINDTQEILELFQDILSDEGFEVAVSSFAPRDLQDILDVDPDLVILDFLMGADAQGWQLLQKMKMRKQTADIPVVVCTGAVQMVKELEGHLTSKGVAVVVKPFDIDDLLDAVRAVMGNITPQDMRNTQGSSIIKSSDDVQPATADRN